MRRIDTYIVQISLLIIGPLATLVVGAQPQPVKRESAGYWATKGQDLMRASQYAEAYTAFQLARSLGGEGMTARMELAKKRNINNIQLRALLSEARLRATTDPTQSLRLLEYARTKFPDSTILLKVIGEVANQPDSWYYTLRADRIKASPTFTYLLADTDKTRLYYRRGDSLTLVHTFSERPILRVFSPGDKYLFVTTGKAKKGSLYTLQGQKMKLYRSYTDTVQHVTFSPNQIPEYGTWLLTETPGRQSTLYDLHAPSVHPTLSAYNCSFSSSGRYLLSPKGLWQLGPIFRPLTANTAIVNDLARFSPDERHLLIRFKWSATERYSISYQLKSYTFLPGGDSLRFTGDTLKYSGNDIFAYGQPFSPDGRYLLANNREGLFFYDEQRWKLVQAIGRGGHEPPSMSNADKSRDWGSIIKFSPDSRHVLMSISRNNKLFIQLWRLEGPQWYLLHEFAEKERAENDIFSPDGKYLLAWHLATTCLWQVDTDTVRLVHTFKKSLRRPDTFDTDGNPFVSNYFSPDSRYLLTYNEAYDATDSLWQLMSNKGGNLLPVHSFRNRLKPEQTLFSTDARFLLTESNGTEPAMFWNINEQVALEAVWPTVPPKQAFFSPRANYLITDLPRIAWHVTDRQLRSFSHPHSFGSPANSLFSPDERHLMLTTPPETETPEKRRVPSQYETALYSLHADKLLKIHRYAVEGFITRFFGKATTLTLGVDPYLSGLFSPDGTQWLQTQAMSGDEHDRRYHPDTLWNLSGITPSAALYLPNRVDRFMGSNPANATSRTWHSLPSALFSYDSRFLMTAAGGKLNVYSLKSSPYNARLLEAKGWPMDVSAKATYWLTGLGEGNGKMSLNADRNDFPIRDTPDSVRLWQRTGPDRIPDLREIFTAGGLYQGLNRYWQGNRRQSWFSKTGDYLLLPTTKPALTTLYTIVGDHIRPIYSPNAQLMAAAHVPSAPKEGWDAGLLYTKMDSQTYLLRYSASRGTRITWLGFGVMAYPPKFQNKLAYWVRKVDDSQQNLEILDLVTTTTLLTIPFGAVLDFTVRPTGDVWVVLATGARLIRSPNEVLRWLKQTPIASLPPALRQTYSFQ